MYDGENSVLERTTMSRNTIEFSYSKSEGPRVALGGKTLFFMMFLWSTLIWGSAAYFGYNLHNWLNYY